MFFDTDEHVKKYTAAMSALAELADDDRDYCLLHAFVRMIFEVEKEHIEKEHKLREQQAMSTPPLRIVKH